MALKTFKGGIHPDEGKELSKDKPIREYFSASELVYPISQHIGAPAKPIVNVGDAVLRGQMIAEAGGFVSAPIYSSVSGTVKAIEDRRNAMGDMVKSIVIENDGSDLESSFEGMTLEEALKLDKSIILDKIQRAGIVGMGGAGFPTHVKLSPKNPDEIKYIIANCAECEPYLTSDYRTMLENTEKLIGGMKIILSLFDNARGVFAVEDNKRDCAIKLHEANDSDRISVELLMTKYPQGGERQLIHAVTGFDINSKMLPADAGCIVDNVATICAIYDAVVLGKPLMDRVFTVSGDNCVDPSNYLIHIGTSMKEILEQAGGENGEAAKYISGGPMMGFAIFDLDVPTTKTATALTCLTKDEVSEFEPTACINCGRCVEVCPGRVIPKNLADAAEHNDEKAFLAMYGMECCECGCCSYICPARRQLTQLIKGMRKIQLGKRKK
jgi:electron transport complex protein RnfC